MPFQKVEYEFPDEGAEDENTSIEVEPSSAITLGSETPLDATKDEVDDSEDSDEYEIEVVDDTPEADRGRKPSEPPEDVTEDELEDYSEKVRKRIQHFSKGYHDERRAKETAFREREELERLSQQLVEENKTLKANANKNQTALLEQAKRSAGSDLEIAKKAYKDAYEAGDSDGVLAAQDSLTNAKIRADKLNNFKIPALQEDETNVKMVPETAPPPVEYASVDERAQAWYDANPWFHQDREMTSLALGLHDKLVSEGVNPQSDNYYERIDSRMRQLFPENFEGEGTLRTKKKSSVVAPATRSTAPKKIRLTQTALRLSKRLGLTPEQYAKQAALDQRKER